MKALLLIVILVTASCSSSDNSPEVTAKDSATKLNLEIQTELLNAVNTFRQAQGQADLSISTPLSIVANNHAIDMGKNNYLSHTSLDGRSPFERISDFGISYSAASENIAQGQTSVHQVMESWKNSPGHRANMLGSDYKKLGVGFSNNYWVQVFTD